MESPLVSVIIPCRNEEAHLQKCIDSILASDFDRSKLEIFVVDGNSTDRSREIIKEYSKLNPSVQLIENPLQVTPVAFNLGIKKATGEFILIVGARHILSSNYISHCVNVLMKDPNCGCVGGMVENVYENEKSRVIAKAMASRFGVGGGNFRTKTEEAYVDTVGTPFYRKKIFEEVGYFDEQLVRNQDDEFNYRVTKKGYKILFTPKIYVKYFVRATFGKLFRQYFQYGYWKVFVNKKHRTVTSLRQLVPFFFMFFLSVFIPISFWSKLASAFLISVVLLYLLIIGAVSISGSKGVKTFRFSVLAFLCLHFGYGLGYYRGIIDFMIFNKKPAESAGKLTR